MRHGKHIWLVLTVVLTTCTRSSSGSVMLSGTFTGLVLGTSAQLRLEQLSADQVPGQGQVITRFSVTKGQWEQAGLVLEPGRYGLFPEAEGYVSRLGTITFQTMTGGGTWSYRHLDFELMRPEDALARVGVPLCSQPPAQGGVYVVPEGPPTPTPTFAPSASTVTASAPPWPPGTCYAGQYTSIQDWSVGIYGVVSGLPPGQVANIYLYVLPPVPDENYSITSAPPLDGSWHYPDALTALATMPNIGLEEPLTMTLTVSNGLWGVMDPGLASRKYLVMAQASGLAANPPAYQVVVFGGKVITPVSGVDFNFGSK